MKYKIQTTAPFGWADLKHTEDGTHYHVELFLTEAEALNEIAQYPDPSDYRVVAADEASDLCLYA